jgi:uncharacterized protein (DUF3084 family)
MSSTAGGTPLDLETVLVQLARAREETLKFTAEQHELMAERSKLEAEAEKLRWDRRLAPWIIATSLISGIVGGLISHLWR